METSLTVLDHAQPPAFPRGAEAMTVLVEIPPGSAGTPPHRHSGPVFGYLLEGALVFELEGDPPRVVGPGETFWEPGGDRVHWQAANALTDATTRFVAVMVCAPGIPMLTPLDQAEIADRQSLRHPLARSGR
jgi:quercetin dioxygenase-like cupin family protein